MSKNLWLLSRRGKKKKKTVKHGSDSIMLRKRLYSNGTRNLLEEKKRFKLGEEAFLSAAQPSVGWLNLKDNLVLKRTKVQD